MKKSGENQNHAIAFTMAGSNFARLREGRAREEVNEFFYFFRRNPLKNPILANKTKQIQAILHGFAWRDLILLGAFGRPAVSS